MIEFTPPRDVFPRRNLGPGEEWGREMETRVKGTENTLGSLALLLKGDNRTSASSLATLGRQIQELEDLYLSIPQVTQQTATSSGFGLVGGWQTVVSGSIPVPARMTKADVVLYGVVWMRAVLSATLIQGQSRVVIDGVAGPAFNTSADAFDPGLGATNAPQYSRTITVSPGGTIPIMLQVNPADPASFPADEDNYGVLTALTSFTG